MVLEGIESVFCLGSGEDDHWRVSKTIEEVEARGTGHFDVEKEKVHFFPVEKFQGISNIEEMPFYFDKFALFTEFS
jgi:hypothetical protein